MSMPAAHSADGGHFGLMDKVYQRQRYIYDFTRKYYLLGRDSLIEDLGLKAGESLVEIGCGTGRNLIAIARRYPGARLFGLDASEQMLRTARDQVERTGLADRVTLVHGLAENLSPSDFGLGSFDHALFSYSLSMIPDWRQAIISASKALSAKGHIHVVDFGDLKTLPGKALLQRWLAQFHVTPRGELLNALEALFAHRNKALTLLPGRYAFRLSTTKANIASLSCCIADTGRG